MNEEDEVQNIEDKGSDEDDCDDYFLQSTPGDYDIREKIRLANDELFEDYESCILTREQKVTFSENLVDYEPDFTSDDGYAHSPDVLSVISDNENEESDQIDDDLTETKDGLIIEEIKYDNFENNNILDAIEEKTIDICNEEIEDNISYEDENILEEEEVISDEQIVEVVEIINDSTDAEINSSSPEPSEDSTVNTKQEYKENNQRKKETIALEKIHCRLHCLEKKELDFINGKPKNYDYLKGPVLKLRQKPCCTNQPFKPMLPVYNGYISEYGMTKTQIERTQKRKEKNMQKKKDKSVRIREEKTQKDLYNEEIFCAWLKSVKNRNNKENVVKNRGRQRPKTAPLPHCNLSIAINIPKIKRPNTSPGCSYKIIFH